jgi:hypothetical protein
MTKLKEHKNISKKCLLVIHSKRVQILPNAELSVPCKPGTPRTCFRLRQKIRYASTRCHVSPRYRNMPPCTTMCPGASTCPRLQTPPLRLGGLRHYHVPRSSGPSSPSGRGPALPRVPQHRTPPC